MTQRTTDGYCDMTDVDVTATDNIDNDRDKVDTWKGLKVRDRLYSQPAT